MNFYFILGVAPTATASEIKTSYRKLAALHHPDRGGLTSKFQQIQAAYDCLSNADKRMHYDRTFGGTKQYANQPQRRNHDIKIHVTVSLLSTLGDHTKELTVTAPNTGSKDVSITIPRGVPQSSTIKYQGLGEWHDTSKPPGDLYASVTIALPKNTWLQHDALYQKLPINALDLITGTGHEFITPFNSALELVIPAGTQPGTVFRVAKHGLMTTQGNRDDLYLVIDAIIPQLSTSQCEILTKAKKEIF
ncbi:curved DNA-binding protein CbpA [uncultured Caudovirales phage]|uniref:Curved DNA-binding protein CbpA n=1 Tax=uncultured Caudovirales phage TaxID=2100421 RepID=A0A6J5LAF7_9CAUD|nr:curved DNA-binding protein CbpA [uncultured Caudovirales phage]